MAYSGDCHHGGFQRRQGGRRRLAWALLLGALAACCEGTDTEEVMGPLLGGYGFLSEFTGLTADEARKRVREMHSLGILEFEFYNAFEGYSHPPSTDKEEWRTAFNVTVKKSILTALIDEIKKLNGRSWLFVNAMATNVGDKALQKGTEVLGQYVVDERPLLDVIIPTAEWAEKFAPAWADWASKLGFSGILWSTMGNFNNAAEKGADMTGFLHKALPILQEKYGLAQTAEFVDGFGFDACLAKQKVIAFSYWSAIDRASEHRFYEAAPQGSVLVMWQVTDGAASPPSMQAPRPSSTGKDLLTVAMEHWQKALCYKHQYLAVGDGRRIVRRDYYPEAVELSEAERDKMKIEIDSPDCQKRAPHAEVISMDDITCSGSGLQLGGPHLGTNELPFDESKEEKEEEEVKEEKDEEEKKEEEEEEKKGVAVHGTVVIEVLGPDGAVEIENNKELIAQILKEQYGLTGVQATVAKRSLSATSFSKAKASRRLAGSQKVEIEFTGIWNRDTAESHPCESQTDMTKAVESKLTEQHSSILIKDASLHLDCDAVAKQLGGAEGAAGAEEGSGPGEEPPCSGLPSSWDELQRCASQHQRDPLAIAILASAAALMLAVVGLLSWCLCCRRARKTEAPRSGTSFGSARDMGQQLNPSVGDA